MSSPRDEEKPHDEAHDETQDHPHASEHTAEGEDGNDEVRRTKHQPGRTALRP